MDEKPITKGSTIMLNSTWKLEGNYDKVNFILFSMKGPLQEMGFSTQVNSH